MTHPLSAAQIMLVNYARFLFTETYSGGVPECCIPNVEISARWLRCVADDTHRIGIHWDHGDARVLVTLIDRADDSVPSER